MIRELFSFRFWVGVILFMLATSFASSSQVRISGKVVDMQTGAPIPYVNIGIEEKNVGTLTDPDGSFYLPVPRALESEVVLFSALGYQAREIAVANLSTGRNYEIKLQEKPISLAPIQVTGNKHFRAARLGWMRGKEGTLPIDAAFGGACAALLLEAPEAPFILDKVYLRILYNTKDTIRFRLRIFAFDSTTGKPSQDLMQRDVFVTGQKRIGWINNDLSEYQIEINQVKFFLGFEWIENESSREAISASLKNWREWKKNQFLAGDERISADTLPGSTIEEPLVHYRFQGNMMNWPGFTEMPPWTGLVVDDERRPGNEGLETFERKASFGEWTKSKSTLNAVIRLLY